ncbi:exocyst complex component 6B-like [Oncorhynchus tshawytscha]|uniref:exocyst complex component 6B-like n=1 Tax=Oncorhynchus tshawytscha TaxID=74940 RepID=UPI001C3DBA53|nr:exocyst complex component 6B-like [Oncorhynchus tshawytscha]
MYCLKGQRHLNGIPFPYLLNDLNVKISLQDARHAAEEEIYTNLNAKIDQFLQLADYDWTAAQGGGAPSDYLSDLIAFLCSTFSVFTHLPGSAIEHARLPGKVAQTACMSACKHLSTSLLQLLLETDVRQVSMGALQQFNTDVKECERFARAGRYPASKETRCCSPSLI